MKSMPTRIATKTSAVPRSGCRKTRKVGNAISAAAPTIVDRRPIRSPRPLSHEARTTIISTLQTSLHWKSSPATVIDICAPNSCVPATIVSSSRPSTARYSGRVSVSSQW